MNNKLKSLLKSVGFIVLYFLFGAALSQLKPLFPAEYERYAQGFLGTIGALLTVFVYLKVEKKSARDYGLNWKKNTLAKFAVGLVLGLVVAAIMIFSQIEYSQLIVARNRHVSALPFLFWSLAFIPLAFMEEIAFRSYPLRTLSKTFGFRTTQFILAILFAVYHILMMWSPQTSFLGPGIWALAYALAAVWSGGIAVPTGLHFGVNFLAALIGGKTGIEPMWTISFPENTTDAAQAANQHFGIGLQLVLLIFCIVATEIYIRKTRAPQKASDR